MNILNQIVEQAEKLEPLPATASKLSQVVANEKSTIDDAAEIIKYDQALSADVLRMANSAFSASKRNIENVRDAVLRLGSGRILEMLISKKIKGAMKYPLEEYGYNEDDLWRHSVASAIAAENLNAYTDIQISGVSFTAALLHDIGKLIMVRVLPPEEMQKIWATMKNNMLCCAAAEKELFGFTHADVGAHIAQIWQLPEVIEQSIRFHHTENAQCDPVTDSVRIANIVARAIGQGIGYEGMGLSIDSEITERLNISRENFERLCAVTSSRLEEVLALYESS